MSLTRRLDLPHPLMERNENQLSNLCKQSLLLRIGKAIPVAGLGRSALDDGSRATMGPRDGARQGYLAVAFKEYGLRVADNHI